MKKIIIKGDRYEQTIFISDDDIYFLSEINAVKLLNSKKVKHSWKKDFKKDFSAKEDWDLINSEKRKIEVKSTIQPYSFSKNYAKLNTPNQYKNIILKVLIDKKGKIKKHKFVIKSGKIWKNITLDIAEGKI